jgi:hypothetical protein
MSANGLPTLPASSGGLATWTARLPGETGSLYFTGGWSKSGLSPKERTLSLFCLILAKPFASLMACPFEGHRNVQGTQGPFNDLPRCGARRAAASDPP